MEKRHLKGWRRDEYDIRDYRLAAHPHYLANPPTHDPRQRIPRAPWDQGLAGSCTAHAGGRVWHDRIALKSKKMPNDVEKPARLAIYGWTRMAQGTFNEDSGASIRGTFKAIDQWGIPHEGLFPYDIKRNLYKKPGAAVVQDAARHNPTGAMYARVPQDLESLKGVLSTDHLVAFGFNVPESFMSQGVAKTGIFKPQDKEQIVGGHAVTLVGYDDGRQAFLVLNSWGMWGDKGYVWMPYSFVLDSRKANDFWTAVDAPSY